MKLRLVITDANILIDLIQLDLALILLKSELFDFMTTDFIFDELFDEQKNILSGLIENNHFTVIESEESDIIEIFQLKQTTNALSFEDCSVWYFAAKLEGILLTGDRQLRNHSTRSGIQVHGILFLFDQMLTKNLITYSLAIEKLTALVQINPRLPQKLIAERIKEWTSQT